MILREAAAYNLKAGDNVIADIAVPCGECLLCKSGDDANCVNMQETNGGSIDEPPYLYGGYAEVNYTPLSNLIKISDELDPEMVAVFACPSPTVMHTINLAKQAGVDFSRIKAAAVQGLGRSAAMLLCNCMQSVWNRFMPLPWEIMASARNWLYSLAQKRFLTLQKWVLR